MTMNGRTEKTIRIGVLASGGGSNLQAILDAVQSGALAFAEVALVIANKEDAFALKRAQKAGVDSLFLDPRKFPSRTDYFERIIQECDRRRVNLVCLAGFLLKIEPNMVKRFKNRMLNIHPALLPKFGGKGMYGHFVHEAVLKAGEKESGCSVHLVDDQFDHGAVILQGKVPVLPGDDPQTLAARVREQEHVLFPEAIRAFVHSPVYPDRLTAFP